MRRKSIVAAIAMSLFTTLVAAATPTPEARVRAFIADYHRAHGASRKIIDAGDFDAWGKVVAQLERAHFVAGKRSGLDGSMGGEADHHPASEIITSNVPQGEIAHLQTHDPQSQITQYYEYDLRRAGDDWRIEDLRGYVESPDEAFMTAEQQSQFQQPTLHPYRALPPNEAAVDGTSMFVHGRRVQIGKDSSDIDVRRVGSLNVTTGVLVVGDLGYDPDTLAPLGRRIAPGRYPVDVSIAFKRVAAMRVVLSDKPVVKWHPADMGAEPGHVVGVDAGNVSISDVSALLTIKTRHKEKQFEKFAAAAGPVGAMMLTLVNADDVVISTSGFGDGAYPVYWGVDAAGQPAVLLVDYLVLSDPGE